MNSRLKQFLANKLIPFLKGKSNVSVKIKHRNLTQAKQFRLNRYNIINGQFRVIMPVNQCIKMLDKGLKKLNKREAYNKKIDVESTKLLNQAKTGYSNPIQTGLNLKNKH